MEANTRWALVAALAPMAWGATYYVTREFLPAEYPVYGALIRALPAGLLLLAVRRERPHGSWWWKAAILGTLNMGAFFVLVYLAAQLLPTSIASTVMALAPLAMMLFAWALVVERPQLVQVGGAAIGILGVGLLLFTGAQRVDGLGLLASVAALVMSSLGFVLSKRWGAGTHVLSSTAWQLLAGSLVLAPAAVLIEGAPPVLDATAVLAFVFVSVVGTAIAFAAWFTALRHLGAGTVGLIGLLNPVTGVVLGTAVAGEILTLQQGVGIVVVLAGVLLGQPAASRLLSRVRAWMVA